MIPSSPTSHLLKFPSSTFSNDVIYDPCEQSSEEDQRQGQNSNRNQIQNQSQFMYQNPSLSPSHHDGHSHSNGHSHCHNYYSGPVAMTPKKQRSKSFLYGGLKLSTNTTVNSIIFVLISVYFHFNFSLKFILVFVRFFLNFNFRFLSYDKI